MNASQPLVLRKSIRRRIGRSDVKVMVVFTVNIRGICYYEALAEMNAKDAARYLHPFARDSLADGTIIERGV